MGSDNSNAQELPLKVKAAFDYLYHTYRLTDRTDATIPARTLTSLEKSVETTALRVVQQYLLGEIECGDEPGEKPAASQPLGGNEPGRAIGSSA
jgi:hypothetical protein